MDGGVVGDVVVEPLTDVWRESGARINNSMDSGTQPFPGQTVGRLVDRLTEGRTD